MADFKHQLSIASRHVYRIGKGLGGAAALIAAISGFSSSDVGILSDKLLDKRMTIETEQRGGTKTKTENSTQSTNSSSISDNKDNNDNMIHSRSNSDGKTTDGINNSSIHDTNVVLDNVTSHDNNKQDNSTTISSNYRKFTDSNFGFSFDYPFRGEELKTKEPIYYQTSGSNNKYPGIVSYKIDLGNSYVNIYCKQLQIGAQYCNWSFNKDEKIEMHKKEMNAPSQGILNYREELLSDNGTAVIQYWDDKRNHESIIRRIIITQDKFEEFYLNYAELHYKSNTRDTEKQIGMHIINSFIPCNKKI